MTANLSNTSSSNQQASFHRTNYRTVYDTNLSIYWLCALMAVLMSANSCFGPASSRRHTYEEKTYKDLRTELQAAKKKLEKIENGLIASAKPNGKHLNLEDKKVEIQQACKDFLGALDNVIKKFRKSSSGDKSKYIEHAETVKEEVSTVKNLVSKAKNGTLINYGAIGPAYQMANLIQRHIFSTKTKSAYSKLTAQLK